MPLALKDVLELSPNEVEEKLGFTGVSSAFFLKTKGQFHRLQILISNTFK